MKLRTDNRARLYGRDILKPNTDYQAEIEGNRVVLVEMVPIQPRIVRARKVKGRWMGAAINLDRKAVAAAVRAERDER